MLTLLLSTALAQTQPTGLDGLSPFTLREGPADLSDWILHGAMVGSVFFYGGSQVYRFSHTPAEAWQPLASTLGANLLTYAFTESTKNLAARPRPYTWDPDSSFAMEGSSCSDRATVSHWDDCKSFFSGHTSLTASSAFSSVTAMHLEGDLDSPLKVGTAYGAAVAATVGVAALRVGAGKHYITDVTVGAVVGTSLGILVPRLVYRFGGGGA